LGRRIEKRYMPRATAQKVAFPLPSAGSIFGSRIRHHPIAAFFAFAFLISWIGWYTAPLIGGADLSIVSLVNIIAGFGPVFAALLVSDLLSPEPSREEPKKRRITFAATFTGSFGLITAASAFVKHNLTVETVFVWLVVSLIAGYVVSCVYHPRRSVAQTLSGVSQISWRSGWVWLGLFLPFVFQAVGGAVDFALGGKEVFTLTAGAAVLLFSSYPFIFFFGGALNEEPGWRGFVTPRLLRRFSPLAVGLIIGVVWSMWHFPLHVTFFDGNDFLGFAFRFVYNLPLGVLFTWLYYQSGGNLFACLLLHSSYNSAGNLFGDLSSHVAIPVMIAFTVAVAVCSKMHKKEQQATFANLSAG
jgi:uncharacterized protein